MADRVPKVLVIDDEPGIARVIARVLRGCDVTTVGDAAAARATLASDASFAVVLCDVMMPGESGIDLHASLRTQAPALAARFVFITGGVLSQGHEDYLAGAGVTCLRKPFTPADLRALVHERIEPA